MPLTNQTASALTRVGTEFKAVRAVIGDLASLTTTTKTSIVGALNEIKASIGAAGAQIDDSAASTSKVYSSSKTAAAIAAAVSGLVNSAPAALDTLKELSDALGGDGNFATTTATALGNRLRVDAVQALTSTQKAQGISNLGAISAASIGDPETDLVAVFVAALA